MSTKNGLSLNELFWEHEKPFCDIPHNLLHLQMVPEHVQALQDMLCAPTVHPTAPTNPTIGANIFEHLSLGIYYWYMLYKGLNS